MNRTENAAFETEALPYLMFTVGRNIYALNCKFVRSIETMGEITTITESDPVVRGGVIYQNQFISLIDMRKTFGLDSQIEEFEKSVQPEQRIKDHERWVSELERSVRERTEFTLTDDPRLCAFGKWLYSFSTDNNVLTHQLNAIKAPHEAVHHTAKIVEELMRAKKYELAQNAIDDLKATHYKTTIGLLSSLRRTMADSLKELYIVIETGDGMKGIIVDTIVGVEYLENTLQTSGATEQPKYVECLRQTKHDKKIIIVLNNSF